MGSLDPDPVYPGLIMVGVTLAVGMEAGLVVQREGALKVAL